MLLERLCRAGDSPVSRPPPRAVLMQTRPSPPPRLKGVTMDHCAARAAPYNDSWKGLGAALMRAPSISAQVTAVQR